MADRLAATGMFDGVHLGHRYLLRQLREEAERRGLEPFVITFDNHPLSIIAPERAPLLLSTAEEKLELIRKYGVEAVSIPFDNALRQTSSAKFLEMLAGEYKVKGMLLGFNNRFGYDAPADPAQYRKIAADAGVELIYAKELPDIKGVSSSAIRQLIAEGEITEANGMLARPYSLTGTVVNGQHIGRTLGFPTANLRPKRDNTPVPKPGVYAAFAILPDGRKAKAVVNIGYRPTIDRSDTPALSIEAFLIDTEENLYNRTLTLEFIARLRDERKFPSLQALKTQITLDTAQAQAILK